MTGIAKDILSVLRRGARRRHFAEASALGLRLLAIAVAVGAAAWLAVEGGLVAADSSWMSAVAAAFAFVAAAAVLGRLVRPARELAEAKRLDDALGLKDRLTSAVSFLSRSERTPFEDAAVRDASAHLDEAREFRDVGGALRRPALWLLAAALFAFALVGGRQAAGLLSGRNGGSVSREVSARPSDKASTDGAVKTPDTAQAPASDNELVAVEDTRLEEESKESALTDAQMKELAAMAGETSEADRLLAQAAYLDESDLSEDGRSKTGSDDRDTVTMKEPDMDALKEMVNEAQKRKKEGKEQDSGGDDINLEVLIKSHASSSSKPPERRPDGGNPSGGGEGTSQDTRIQPRRVEVGGKAEFRIVSVRSLTPPGTSDEKRIVLSEAVMRASGVPQPPLVEAKAIPQRAAAAAEPTPRAAQGVPVALRPLVSKYFEGLRELEKPTQP